MTETSSWRPLGRPAGSTQDVVLAVNYTVAGRPEASFADLKSNFATPIPLWETVPPPPGSEKGMTADEYVTRWTDDVRRSGRSVRAILGNCAGSAYLPALSSRISEWQEDSPVQVVFDPEPPSALMLYVQFHQILTSVGSLLSADELKNAQQSGQQLMHEIDDLAQLADALTDLFAQAGGTAFSRLGLNQKRSTEMVTLFSSYLAYLVTAGQVTTPDAWASAVAVSSSTPTSGLNRIPEHERVTRVAQEMRFDVDHEELLRSPLVARAVEGIIS